MKNKLYLNKISNLLSKNKKSELKIFKINPNFENEEEKQILLYNTEFNNEISQIKNSQTSFSEYLKSINLINIKQSYN